MRQLGTAAGRRRGGVAVLAVALASVAVGVTVVQARPAVQQVELKLVGQHAKDAGYHEGTFTATLPLCPSGTWLGDSEEDGDGIRDFTCDDKSGTFSTDFVGDSEHQTGGTGPWAITGGTGKWKKLRGAGTAVTDESTGPGPPPIEFKSTWTGVVDFDARGPSVKITKATAVKSGRNWKVTVAFTSVDNVRSNAVTFRVTATSGTFFAAVLGTIGGGKGGASFVFRRSEAGSSIVLRVHALDPWQNESAIGKELKLA